MLEAIPALTQDARFPLESVAIEGSTIPQPVIQEMAGLHLNAPIDKSGIEEACRKLQESGLFSSISYRYAPGPRKGYALTLVLADQTPLTAAAIDVPGADEDVAWKWLAAKFHRFDHQVPQAEAAQNYLARLLEQHLAAELRKQPLTVRMETDLKTRKLLLSFQPEVLPRIQSVSFAGNQTIASPDLLAVLNRILANEGYTDRKFAGLIEVNLRPLYEQHGLYRVGFSPAKPQWTDGGVVVKVDVTEGQPYQLGKIDIVGDDLPADRMLSAARLPVGKLANWTQIQTGIWEMEKIVKRTGYFEATARADRSYDDADHIFNLGIRVRKGPLYSFGELRITGLSPQLQERARAIWKLKSGEPYDYAYPSEFFQAFSRTIDFRVFRKYDAAAHKGAGDHVMDIDLIFEAR